MFRRYRGCVLLWTGAPDEAASSFHEAISMGSETLAAMCLASCASPKEALAALDRCRPAGNVWDEMVPAFAAALRGDKPSPSARVIAAAAEGNGSSAMFMAGPWALVNVQAQALHWMRIAIERGFTNDRWWLEWDPFMARYRDDPEFQSLVAKARQIRESEPA